MVSLLLAIVLSLPGDADAFSLLFFFPRVGKVLESIPKPEQTKNLYDALEILSQTETGRRVMSEAGVSLAVDESGKLGEAEIYFRVGVVDHYAHVAALPKQKAGKKRFILLINQKYSSIHPAALAPIIGHELAHIKDLRSAPASENMRAATERRGYLLQAHIAVELMDQGLLPSADPGNDPDEADVILNHRFLINVWEGDPIPPGLFGSGTRFAVKEMNTENRLDPGLPALLKFGDLKQGINAIPGWNASRKSLSPYIQKFDRDLLKEDRIFRKKAAQRDAKEAASAARAARMPSDAAETLAALAKKACVAPALIGPSDLEPLHSWFPNRGHDIPSSGRVGAPLAGCEKEMYELLVAYHHAWRPESKMTFDWIHAEAAMRIPASEDPGPVPVPVFYPVEPLDSSAWELSALAKKACASPGSIGGSDMGDINVWFPNPGIPGTKSKRDSLSGCAKELYLELLGKNRTHEKGNGLNYEWVNYRAEKIKNRPIPRPTPPPPTRRRGTIAPPPRPPPPPRGEVGPECMKTRCVPL